MTWSREGDRNHIPRANPVCVCVSSAQINHPRRRHDLNAKTRRDAKSQPAGTNTDGARVRESGVFHIHAYIYIYIYLYIYIYNYIYIYIYIGGGFVGEQASTFRSLGYH